MFPSVPEPAPTLLESIRPLRRREYDRLVDLGSFDDERIELLGGRLVTMSPQGTEHADVISRLATLLVKALADRAIVRSHSPLVVADDSEPEPDVAVVQTGDYSCEHPSAALLVVEVSDSSLRTDREVKGPLYAAAGIQEYWIVNLVDRVVEVHRARHEGRYSDVSRHARDATLRPLAFADFVVEVGELMR
jgi:Uma2 family endonuclease